MTFVVSATNGLLRGFLLSLFPPILPSQSLQGGGNVLRPCTAASGAMDRCVLGCQPLSRARAAGEGMHAASVADQKNFTTTTCGVACRPNSSVFGRNPTHRKSATRGSASVGRFLESVCTAAGEFAPRQKVLHGYGPYRDHHSGFRTHGYARIRPYASGSCLCGSLIYDQNHSDARLECHRVLRGHSL